jgi:hypothetical protein
MQPENACKYYNKWQGSFKVKTTIHNLGDYMLYKLVS